MPHMVRCTAQVDDMSQHGGVCEVGGVCRRHDGLRDNVEPVIPSPDNPSPNQRAWYSSDPVHTRLRGGRKRLRDPCGDLVWCLRLAVVLGQEVLRGQTYCTMLNNNSPTMCWTCSLRSSRATRQPCRLLLPEGNSYTANKASPIAPSSPCGFSLFCRMTTRERQRERPTWRQCQMEVCFCGAT